MLIIYNGSTGSGKTHIIYNTYSVIKIARDNRSLSHLLLTAITDEDGKERCAWINCSTFPPTKEEWMAWKYWSDRSDMPIIVEIRDTTRIPVAYDKMVQVVANAQEIREYARMHQRPPKLVEKLTNWWKVKSLVHGNSDGADDIYRGFGEWSDPIEVFNAKPLDPKLIRYILGAVRQFPQHYPIVKAINEVAREQGVTSEMLRPLIAVLPRRQLTKKWAIPYTQQDANPFMKWLRSIGLDRESYHASLGFEMETQYKLARLLQKSQHWKAGWKALKKSSQTTLTIEEIMNVVFENPIDTLQDDLDIRAII